MVEMSSRFLSDGSGLEWYGPLPGGKMLRIQGLEIRHQRTGVHARVVIGIDNTILGYDTFNVGRDAERRKLVNSSHKALGDMAALVQNEDLRHQVDLFCLYLTNKYEEARIEIEQVDAEWNPPLKRFALPPYLLAGSGGVLFAPPGSGKSYMVHAMALALATGSVQLFHIEQTPALYVNLERSRESVFAREVSIMRALSLRRPSGLSYINARGVPLTQLLRRIQRWARNNPDGVVFLDSLSRATHGGSLTEDQTANQFVDAMNSIEGTWLAIGHTPRSTESRMFGSVHFDAGVDVAIKLNSIRTDTGRLMGMEVTKANDIAFPPKVWFAMEFGESGLEDFRRATDEDMSVLSSEVEVGSLVDLICEAIVAFEGQATATEISEYLDKPRGTIARTLSSRRDMFTVAKKDGRNVYYAVKQGAQG